jgi:hypothetical protein
MPFTITISTAIDTVSFSRETPQQTLDTMRQLQNAGMRWLEVSDRDGKRLTEHQLELLSMLQRKSD